MRVLLKLALLVVIAVCCQRVLDTVVSEYRDHQIRKANAEIAVKAWTLAGPAHD